MTGSKGSTVPTLSAEVSEERRRRRELKKKKKEEKKKKKNKRKHERMMSSSPEDDDAVSDSVAPAVISSSKEVTKLEEKKEQDGTPESRVAVEKKKKSSKEKKKKKKKEKRKEKKRRRRHVDDDDDDDTKEDMEKRTKKKKRRMEKEDEEQQRNDGGGGDDDAKEEKKKTTSSVAAVAGTSSSSASSCSVRDNGTTTTTAEEPTIVGGRVAVSSALQYLGNTNKSNNTSATGGDGSSGTEEKKDESKSTSSTHGDSAVLTTTNTAQSSNKTDNHNDVTLLLFYQYVDPPWDQLTFQKALHFVQQTGERYNITGRMRVATEGLNCTLTGSYDGIRSWCAALRTFGTRNEFIDTEFKLTDHLPHGQLFPKLHAFKVTELVNYGLSGSKAPSITKTGTHLEPAEYHTKIAQNNTVLIDVRNHYEANIGHFQPPPHGAQWLDPKMRKSTEFPPWLDKPETREQLRGKQVLMYCTGGVRCERASALLREKMETDPTVAELGIKGVYQLQGGIDKYFKEFPDGGYWKGKNYVFDKRFAHAPPAVEAEERTTSTTTTVVNAVKSSVEKDGDDDAKIKTCKGVNGDSSTSKDSVKAKDYLDTTKKLSSSSVTTTTKMGKCESCSKPWDMYRGKRRCPTCGVPSLICRDCYNADKAGIRKLNKSVRCSLCVEENVTSKFDIRERERLELEEYERKERDRRRRRRDNGGNDDENQGGKEMNGSDENGGQQEEEEVIQRSSSKSSNGDTTSQTSSSTTLTLPPNPENITRLLLKNLHAKRINESILLSHIPNITHIYWITDRKRQNKFYGSAFVEMKTPYDAAFAVGMGNNKVQILGRVLKVQYMKADGKDVWPPPNCQVGGNGGLLGEVGGVFKG